jgi:acid phosphatase
MKLFLKASVLALNAVSLVLADKPYSQEARDQLNILKHQGGHGPYSDHSGFGIDNRTPKNCVVDQVQVVCVNSIIKKIIYIFLIPDLFLLTYL